MLEIFLRYSGREFQSRILCSTNYLSETKSELFGCMRQFNTTEHPNEDILMSISHKKAVVFKKKPLDNHFVLTKPLVGHFVHISHHIHTIRLQIIRNGNQNGQNKWAENAKHSINDKDIVSEAKHNTIARKITCK